MNEKINLVSVGGSIAGRNKRYVVWFYLLNLVLAHFGAAAFNDNAHAILDRSLHADNLLHGFNLGVFIELLGRPEFGALNSSAAPAMLFAFVFFFASLLFMPGVLLGYASDHRLPRDEFYRACGRNAWRFVRLLLFFVVIGAIVAGILFGVQNALADAADKTSNERLPFLVQLAGTAIDFLLLTAIRIWIDLAQTEVVLRDEPAVRKAIASAFRKTHHNFWRLLGSYVTIALVALAVLAGGIWLWHAIVPPSSVAGAFIVGEATLLLLLATRFWQRAVAVAFYVQELTNPVHGDGRSVAVFASPAV